MFFTLTLKRNRKKEKLGNNVNWGQHTNVAKGLFLKNTEREREREREKM